MIRVSALYLRPDTPGSISLSEFPEREQGIIEDDYAALREAIVLRCLYRKGNAAEVYHFGHRQTPAAAEQQQLLARHPLHPLLQVGGGRINCPATSSMLRALNDNSWALHSRCTGYLVSFEEM